MNTQTLRLIASTLLCCSLLLLIAAYPLANALPSWWGFENQPVENTQVALLAAALVVSVVVFYTSASPRRWFGLALVPIFMIVIGRELSWGAVFFEPIHVGEHGPFFTSQGLWYKPAVAPVVAGLILLCCVVIAASPLPRAGIRLLKARRVPIWSIATAAVALLMCNSAEGHLPLVQLRLILDGGVSQLMEELTELSAYGAMIAALMFTMADIGEVEKGLAER